MRLAELKQQLAALPLCGVLQPRRPLTLQLGSGVDSPADTHERQPSGMDRRRPAMPTLPPSVIQGCLTLYAANEPAGPVPDG